VRTHLRDDWRSLGAGFVVQLLGFSALIVWVLADDEPA
jgi:hypothetical protein